MKTEQAIQVLRNYNLWRRADGDMEQPDPREIGKAIDDAIEAMEELNEWKTLNGWGGTPEIINDFIKGQQSRIYAAQEAEQQRDRLAEALRSMLNQDDGSAIRAGILLRSLGLQSPTNPNEP
jgi:hypothetical protein